jgi:acyl carrier protein
MQLNYVESGYVDSLGFIQFIATIEDEFAIEFTSEEMANPELNVVGTLIELIESKIK